MSGRLGSSLDALGGSRGRLPLWSGSREGNAQELPRFPLSRSSSSDSSRGGGVRPGVVPAPVVSGVDRERVALSVRLPLGHEGTVLVVEADEGLRQILGPAGFEGLLEPLGLVLLVWAVDDEGVDALAHRRLGFSEPAVGLVCLLRVFCSRGHPLQSPCRSYLCCPSIPGIGVVMEEGSLLTGVGQAICRNCGPSRELREEACVTYPNKSAPCGPQSARSGDTSFGLFRLTVRRNGVKTAADARSVRGPRRWPGPMLECSGSRTPVG